HRVSCHSHLRKYPGDLFFMFRPCCQDKTHTGITSYPLLESKTMGIEIWSRYMIEIDPGSFFTDFQEHPKRPDNPGIADIFSGCDKVFSPQLFKSLNLCTDLFSRFHRNRIPVESTGWMDSSIEIDGNDDNIASIGSMTVYDRIAGSSTQDGDIDHTVRGI